MKHLLVVVLLLLAIGQTFGQTAGSQDLIRIDNYLMQGKHYANSAGDSVTVFGIAYGGGDRFTSSLAVGQLPDSIRVAVYGTGDTVNADFNLKVAPAGGQYKYVLADSITVALTTKGVRAVGVAKASWYGMDNMVAAFLQRSSGASGVAANCKMTLRIERYFRITKKG